MTTMKEDYVSFETAKLLKEKGFDVYGDGSFNSGIEVFAEYSPSGTLNKCVTSKPHQKAYPAPTLQMAMKWLREIQGINIYARGVWKDVEVQYGDWEPAVVGYEWFVESLTDDTYSKTSTEQFLTYEEACEAAIKYCLENLI